MNKEKHSTTCRARWERLKKDHRCPVCTVKLPDGYKFIKCFECRLKNAEAKRRSRMVK